MRSLALLTLLLLAAPAQAQTFGAQEDRLDNGMQIVVIPNHRAPVMTHMVWYKVGAADELPGKSGMAHYLEHLLFKGTEKMAPGDFSKTIKTLGGNDNAFTGQDYTAYFQSISIDHLKRVMEMEADRMTGANPPTEHYTSEKSVVLEERRQRTDNDPREIFREAMNSALYTNHPYANPVIGWMNEIERYEWADVKEFYKKWYAPNNAILIISGDVEMKDVKPLAEATYGKIAAQNVPPRTRTQVPPSNGRTLMRLNDPSVHQAVFQRIYLAPSGSRLKEDSLALQVLAEILDGGPTTRLYHNLVVTQKKATDIGFYYNSGGLDYGSIHLSAIPATGTTLEELEALVAEELRAVINDGVTQEEVAEAIQRLRDEAVFARDSLSGPAMIFGAALTTGSSLADIEYWPENVAKVTAQDVHRVAKTYLNADAPWVRPPVTGYMMPASSSVERTPEETPPDAQ